MATQRFDIRREPDGSWTVYDVFTGATVAVSGSPMTGLDVEEADDLVDLLNLRDARRRGVLGKP